MSNQIEFNLENLIIKLRSLSCSNEKKDDNLSCSTEKEDNLLQEIIDNKWFENCELEKKIGNIIFYLLNYGLKNDNLIDDKLIQLFKTLFSHSDHCCFIAKTNEHSCKINLELYRSNWMRIYFESICKVHDYNLNLMCDQLIEFLFILFKKSSNQASKNLEFISTINNLISNTQDDLIEKEKNNRTNLNERKRKIILLIVLILDGQYQSYIDVRIIKKTLKFLDMAGIRMYWENLNECKDVKTRVDNILKFCETLIKTNNMMMEE